MIGGVSCHITILELSFPGPNTRQVLESHIMTYIISPWKSELVSWLISPQGFWIHKLLHVERSYNMASSPIWHPLLRHSYFWCRVKHEIFKPFEGNSKPSHWNKARTTNSFLWVCWFVLCGLLHLWAVKDRGPWNHPMLLWPYTCKGCPDNWAGHTDSFRPWHPAPQIKGLSMRLY